jgi:hypothetical protein
MDLSLRTEVSLEDLVVGKTYRVQHYHFNDLIMEDMGRVNEIDGGRITFERVGYDSTFGHLAKIGEIYHVPRYKSPVFGHNYHWRVFESGQDAYVRRTDLSLRTEVSLEDLIVGDKYDLHISVIDRPNTMGFETLKEDDMYDLENMTFKGKKDKAKWASKYDNNKLLFEDSDGKKTTVEGDRTYNPHPHNLNKAYRTKTLGDVLSTKNPDKKQSSAALRALTPLYGNTDMMTNIMKYGGKKKRKTKTKTKTKKRTSIKRRSKKHVKKSRRIKK